MLINRFLNILLQVTEKWLDGQTSTDYLIACVSLTFLEIYIKRYFWHKLIKHLLES